MKRNDNRKKPGMTLSSLANTANTINRNERAKDFRSLIKYTAPNKKKAEMQSGEESFIRFSRGALTIISKLAATDKNKVK